LIYFSDAGQNADAHSFAALMKHVGEVDNKASTVLMIQVENELGCAGRSTRSFCGAADEAFKLLAPRPLMDYLTAHKKMLIPGFLKSGRLWV